MLRSIVRRTAATPAPQRTAAHQRSRTIFGSAAVSGAVALITSVLKPIGFGYAVVSLTALAAQRKLQYFPSAEAVDHPRLMHPMFAEIEEHEVRSVDGTKCLLWHWPAPARDAPPIDPWYLGDQATSVGRVMASLRREHSLSNVDVLQFHGNAGSRVHRLAFMHLMREGLGCSVTVLDYRGYGGSEGSPTERGLIMDGRAAYDWLRARQQQRPPRSPTSTPSSAALPRNRRHVVLWGESIGSGVAVALLEEEVTKLARRAPPDTSLVLEAGFTSCVDLGAHAYPWLPVRLGMLDRFDSAARAKRMAALLGEDGERSFASLSLHGELDEIAPLQYGEGLHAALPGGKHKRLVVLPRTGHNDVQFVDPPRYLREVASFLSEEVVPRSIA